jgi:hypothetical protein
MGSESAPADASTLLPAPLRKPGAHADMRPFAMAAAAGR